MQHKSPTRHEEPGPAIDGRKSNAAQTQAALKAAGRQLFGQRGYEATALGALCERAGVTTGALYHHFGDKKGLFAAVAEDLDAGLVALTSRARDQANIDEIGNGQACCIPASMACTICRTSGRAVGACNGSWASASTAP